MPLSRRLTKKVKLPGVKRVKGPDQIVWGLNEWHQLMSQKLTGQSAITRSDLDEMGARIEYARERIVVYADQMYEMGKGERGLFSE